jgi:catechol 2,3-dioxygenase-like lactoylglutathione lyase family enzyme
VIQRFTLALLLGAALLTAQTESPVVGVGPFLHIVSDLDQSIAFYHGQLGLELTGPAGEHKFTDNPAVASLYGVPGKQFRAAVLKIPGSAMGIELVQWGEARKPKGEPLSGTGVATLILRRAESAKMLHDPDGFPVDVEQADNPGADLSIAVSDVRKSTALYAGVLGSKLLPFRFTKAKPGHRGSAPFPAVGDGMLRIFVRNIDALTASLKSAGFSVITTGGAPVILPQGPRVIIVQDPNNFFLQPMEMR